MTSTINVKPPFFWDIALSHDGNCTSAEQTMASSSRVNGIIKKPSNTIIKPTD